MQVGDFLSYHAAALSLETLLYVRVCCVKKKQKRNCLFYNVPGKKDRISMNFYSYVVESENKTGGTGSE